MKKSHQKIHEEKDIVLNSTQDFPPEKPINGNNNDSDEKISIIDEFNFSEEKQKSSCCKSFFFFFLPLFSQSRHGIKKSRWF